MYKILHFSHYLRYLTPSTSDVAGAFSFLERRNIAFILLDVSGKTFRHLDADFSRMGINDVMYYVPRRNSRFL